MLTLNQYRAITPIKSLVTSFIFLSTSLFPLFSSFAQEFWQRVNGLPRSVTKAVTTNARGDIFVGVFRLGVFRSSDSGQTWQAINTRLTSNLVYSLDFNSQGDIFAATAVGVFRSHDNGEHWALRTKGMGETTIRVLAFNRNGDVFAGGHKLFRSMNNGDNWTELTGLPEGAEVLSLAINSTGMIFVGLAGGPSCSFQ